MANYLVKRRTSHLVVLPTIIPSLRNVYHWHEHNPRKSANHFLDSEIKDSDEDCSLRTHFLELLSLLQVSGSDVADLFFVIFLVSSLYDYTLFKDFLSLIAGVNSTQGREWQ